MKNKLKNQKGAISLFVLLSMMFFMAFMLGAFTLVNRRNATQLEALSETQKIYSNKPTASEQYDSIFVQSGSSVVPITNIDQLKQVKIVTDSNTKYKYLINGKVYTYEKNADYVLQNDIILDFDDTFNGKKATGTGTAKLEYYDYVLYNSTYNINLNGHSIYYQKKSDNSLWKLVCYQNANDSTNGYFSANSVNPNYVGKAYTANAFSLIDDGIYAYKKEWATDANYEFMLMYSIGTDSKFDTANKYNRWRQKFNPKDDTTDSVGTVQNVPGYSATVSDIKLTGNSWSGLTKSTRSETYLDGSTSSGSWFYAVASKTAWNSGIPSNSDAAKECLLFVRYK